VVPPDDVTVVVVAEVVVSADVAVAVDVVVDADVVVAGTVVVIVVLAAVGIPALVVVEEALGVVVVVLVLLLVPGCPGIGLEPQSTLLAWSQVPSSSLKRVPGPQVKTKGWGWPAAHCRKAAQFPGSA
jgi:hypothetical protein